MTDLKKLVLIGGAYNPPHFGHLRLAVEIMEAIAPDRLDLIPSGTPPHKPGRGILPFEMRMSMLKEATAHLPNLFVNPLENERHGPSYTWDTLAIYREKHPDTEIFFVLGGGDFALIDTWHKGLDLPRLCHLLIVERSGVAEQSFYNTVTQFWPDARPCRTAGRCSADTQKSRGRNMEESTAALAPAICSAFNIGETGSIQFLPLPRLDISATMIRKLWLAGRNIDFLLPGRVIQTLDQNRPAITRCWS